MALTDETSGCEVVKLLSAQGGEALRMQAQGTLDVLRELYAEEVRHRALFHRHLEGLQTLVETRDALLHRETRRASAQVDRRLDDVEVRTASRFAGLEARVDRLESKQKDVAVTLETLDKRLGVIEGWEAAQHRNTGEITEILRLHWDTLRNVMTRAFDLERRLERVEPVLPSTVSARQTQ